MSMRLENERPLCVCHACHLQFITPSLSAVVSDLSTSNLKDPLGHIPHSPITRVMAVLQNLKKRGLSRIWGTFPLIIGLRYLYPCGSRLSPILLACVLTPCSDSPFWRSTITSWPSVPSSVVVGLSEGSLV